MVIETPAADVIQGFRRVERLLARPPTEFLEALSHFDPDRRALVLAPPISIGPLPGTLDGRRLFGRRQPASLALEDKVEVDAFWDRAGVARAPSAIVRPDLTDVAGAARGRDYGQGVVVAADAREGIHGWGEGLRWARDSAELAKVIDVLRAISDRVRVMPFIEGIPCSIHGIVFPDHVVAVRPVEMVTLRQPPRLRCCGAATFWAPPRRRRTETREVARRVGETLRETIGYRGAFTVDGVMTEQGFLPTELNPRFGAGLGVIGRAIPKLPLGLLQLAIVEGLELGYRPADLEEMLVAGANQHRGGGAWTNVSRVFPEMQEVRLVRTDFGSLGPLSARRQMPRCPVEPPTLAVSCASRPFPSGLRPVSRSLPAPWPGSPSPTGSWRLGSARSSRRVTSARAEGVPGVKTMGSQRQESPRSRQPGRPRWEDRPRGLAPGPAGGGDGRARRSGPQRQRTDGKGGRQRIVPDLVMRRQASRAASGPWRRSHLARAHAPTRDA